jgi:hypothetical protein
MISDYDVTRDGQRFLMMRDEIHRRLAPHRLELVAGRLAMTDGQLRYRS